MPDEEDNKEVSPEPTKENNDLKDPVPDFGTPLKAPKDDNVVEKKEVDD